MSTLVSEIIVQAFREGNFIAVGESTTAEELAEAVPKLNNFLNSLFGIELGEQYRDWYAPSENDPVAPLRFPLTPTGTGEMSAEPWAYPPPNVRLVVSFTTASTLYLPAMPNDGARMALVDVGSLGDVTLDGNGRKIEGASLLTLPAADLNGRKWLYRADLGNWLRLNTLAAGDPVPLPPEFDELLVCGLAIRLAPRFGVTIAQTTAECYTDMLGRLKKRYKQSERMPTAMEMRGMMRSEI
jgi:hypothetical protein